MKVAYVTGATGCIGRNIVDCLQEQGWRIIVLHRKSSDLSKLKGCAVEYREIDFGDADSLIRAMDVPADAIFHPAANLSHSARDAEVQWRDNVLGTRNLIEASLARQVKRFIFTSTAATFSHRWTDERLANKLIKNSYIRTKRLSELEVYQGIERGLDAVILQPAIVIGPYDNNNYKSIFEMMRKSGPKIIFPGSLIFCHARDVAMGHLLAYEKGRTGESYLLKGVYTTWLDLGQRIAKKYNSKGKIYTVPEPLLWVLALLAEFQGFLTRKTPLLTREVVTLMEDVCDFPAIEQRRVTEDLGYTSQSLDQMISDYISWAEKQGV